MNQRFSIHSVNILFLIVLVLQTANFFFMNMPQFLRLILNEAFFVLLPSLIYLRWAGLPFKKTVRFQWPGWTVALAALLIGAGLYPVSALSGALFEQILGYQITGAEQLLPSTIFEGIPAVIARTAPPAPRFAQVAQRHRNVFITG